MVLLYSSSLLRTVVQNLLVTIFFCSGFLIVILHIYYAFTYVVIFQLSLSYKNANKLCGVKITFVQSTSTKNNIW